MTILFVILVILAAVVLGLIVLVQNPKGGGLAGNIAGFSNQFMGVKQTTDVLEKGTWIFAGIIGLLCLISAFFIRTGNGDGLPDSINKAAGAPAPQQATPQTPANTGTFPTAPDSAQK
ncbi:MAG TPA: preprotein translocase subunit SecG [Chitinophagaceae bacterium]|nr:preprotein translocase subunit SecG [Chitinophagaceae bacterium]